MKITDIRQKFSRLAARSLALVMAVMAVSCGREEIEGVIPVKDGILVCTPCVAEMTTKSQISSAEDKLSEASVAVYDASGTFIRSVYKTDMNGIEFPLLHIGETYRVYAAFNMGDIAFPVSESDIASLTHSWDVSGMNSKGLPMVWSGTVEMTSASQNVSMQAVRLVSKIIFHCDDSGLDDHNGSFTVSSVALKNATKTVSVFGDAQSLKGEADYSSDSATAADVTSLNAGGKVSFYTFENLCGTLLAGNTDPWKKVPENISGNAAKCTYLEVTGTYSTDRGTASAPVTYRMYLGENATTNFDLLRNYVYDVTLCPSDEGIDRTSWKITRGSFTSDSRFLSFTPASVTMNLNGSATFTVTPTPSDMKYEVKGGDGFGSSTLTLVSTGRANEYSLVSSGTLTADASTSVVATSWDGRVRSSLPVTVKAKVITKTETKEEWDYYEKMEWDDGYWVKINGKTSDELSVGAIAGNFTFTATAGHVHHVQDQKRYRTYEEYTWSNDSISTGKYSSWSKWMGNGEDITTEKEDIPSLSSDRTWLKTTGFYDENKESYSRDADITAEVKAGNTKKASATLRVYQAAASFTYKLTCTGSPIVLTVGESKMINFDVAVNAKYFTYINGNLAKESLLIPGYDDISFTTGNSSVADVSFFLLYSVKGVAVGSTKLYVTYKGISSKDNDDSGVEVTVVDKESYSINVSPNALTFNSTDAGADFKQTVTVTCPKGDWEIISTPEGWTVTPNGSNIEIYPNAVNINTAIEKKGTVTVRCKGDTSKTATVNLTQKYDDYDIDVN